MTPQEAKQAVVDWLKAGGKPNEIIPFEYDYVEPVAEDGQACAGAAMAYLLGLESCRKVGAIHFEDSYAFFGWSYEFDVDKPKEAAAKLESMEIIV